MTAEEEQRCVLIGRLFLRLKESWVLARGFASRDALKLSRWLHENLALKSGIGKPSERNRNHSAPTSSPLALGATSFFSRRSAIFIANITRFELRGKVSGGNRVGPRTACPLDGKEKNVRNDNLEGNLKGHLNLLSLEPKMQSV